MILLCMLVSGSPAGSLGPTYIADHPRQMPGIDVMPRPDHGVAHDALDGSPRRLVPRRLFIASERGAPCLLATSATGRFRRG